MNSVYKRNKARAIFTNTEPTLTDQAGANETDINVIVARYGISNQLPVSGEQPMYGDFSELPEDLRDYIETARTFAQHRQSLPEAIRDLPVEELLALTPEELTNKLTPPAPKPEDKETKE